MSPDRGTRSYRQGISVKLCSASNQNRCAAGSGLTCTTRLTSHGARVPSFQASIVFCLLGMVAMTVPAVSQQHEISRYDLYTGFSDLNTPGLNNLNQAGFHLQTGVNLSTWTALGFDYSVQNGSSTLTLALTPVALQTQLAAELPPGYRLSLPFSAVTQSFTDGGQIVIRHYRGATFYARPVLAAFHINAVPHPNDAVTTVVSAQLAPDGHLTDWFGAYGAGGAAEFSVSHWLGARVQFDAGWNHPLSSIIDHGSVSYRYSVGPAFHFGPRLHRHKSTAIPPTS